MQSLICVRAGAALWVERCIAQPKTRNPDAPVCDRVAHGPLMLYLAALAPIADPSWLQVLGGRYTMLAPIPHNDCVVDGIGEDGNPSCKKWGWYWDGESDLGACMPEDDSCPR